MLNKNDLLIIVPSHGFIFKYIKELGYQVQSPYIGKSFLSKVIRKLHFQIGLPGKSIWYNRKSITEKNTIILYEALVTKGYIVWLHKHNINKRIILIYSNLVKVSINPKDIDTSYVELWTADEEDAVKYNMHLWRGGSYFPQWKIENSPPQFDVFYIGKDKNRMAQLSKIEHELNEHGLSSFFYITWERGWQKKNDGIHKPTISYEEVLNYIGKTKAILHLLDGAQKGITIRIQEALIHKKKLITDDKGLMNYDFYDPNNIFILGVDDMNRLKEFLKTPFKDVESEFYKHAYYDDMISEILSITD